MSELIGMNLQAVNYFEVGSSVGPDYFPTELCLCHLLRWAILNVPSRHCVPRHSHVGT